VIAELKLRARQDPEFPSHNTFARFGGKARLAARLIDFCQEHEGYEDVAAICTPISLHSEPEVTGDEANRLEAFGSVYLLKYGRYYKIGRTNSLGRRERELALQLPERTVLVHSIKTDDPAGIESYWHKRFGDRRKNGEWFELSANDVSAFRRREFM
jgi:hypothetical protein